MKAIIVDDEPKAIQLIQTYLDHFSAITVVGTFRNGLKAFEFLTQNPVDLIFLDINMPHITGISLSKMLPRDIKIIFTTAYSEYAVESYDVQAFDYLLKPISLERFTKSMSRLLAEAKPSSKVEKEQVLSIKSGGETFRVNPREVCYLEKDGNYMIYHLEDRSILGRATVAAALAELPDTFIQTHKSFAVQIDKISSYDKTHVTVKDRKIPVSPSLREQVLARLRGA
jgi:two-component system LytT family response regulator